MHLVAPDFLSKVVQRLDHLEPELLPLLVLGHGNVLDMAYSAERMNAVFQKAISNHASRHLKINISSNAPLPTTSNSPHASLVRPFLHNAFPPQLAQPLTHGTTE